MADIVSTLYEAPADYQTALAAAEEVGDIRYLHASAAVVRMGAVPIVLLENLNISMQINRSPIYAISSIVPLGFDVQGVSVNVSGQLVQLAKMSLANSAFYPSSEADIIANINRVFNIDIIMYDHTKPTLDASTGPFITVKNCQNTGSNIVINPNTMIKDSFTAVGTMMERDWDQLATFNEEETPATP